MKKRPRPTVAHFVPFYLPRTETFIYDVLTHHERYRPVVLAQHRAETSMLFPFPDVQMWKDLRRRWSRDWWYRQIRWRLGARAYVAYESFLERRRARVLHVHFGHTGTQTVTLSRRLGIPQVTAFYGWDDTVALDDGEWRPRFKRLFRDGEAFLVEGSHVARRLADRGCPSEKIHVHRIGINVDRIAFRPPSPPAEGEPVRVLFCGRLVEKKGLVDGLRALAHAGRNGASVSLRVVGDGPLRAAIEREIDALALGSVVTLLGATTRETFHAELADCHICVQPSVTAADGETEGGAPTVLLEAQAAGKPILTTWHADIPEIVHPGESAVLVPERAPEALGHELLRLCREPERWAAMGAAGRRHVEVSHRIETQMNRLEALYDQLCEEHKRHGATR